MLLLPAPSYSASLERTIEQMAEKMVEDYFPTSPLRIAVVSVSQDKLSEEGHRYLSDLMAEKLLSKAHACYIFCPELEIIARTWIEEILHQETAYDFETDVNAIYNEFTDTLQTDEILFLIADRQDSGRFRLYSVIYKNALLKYATESRLVDIPPSYLKPSSTRVRFDIQNNRTGFCINLLNSAFPPYMANFVDCRTQDLGGNRLQVSMNLTGGVLGTPYQMIGRVIFEANTYHVIWDSWNTVLIPRNASFSTE